MNDPAFFGYGSLVNCATHSYADARPARLRGWRRVWRSTALRQAAFLSVEPEATTVLHGLVARVPNADWTALDQREAAYARHDVSHLVTHDGPELETGVYQVEAGHLIAGRDHPILLSYLDVVVQGYLQVYGPVGVQQFFDTTDGWNTSVFDDRARPLYPRNQRLSTSELALVDRHLTAVM